MSWKITSGGAPAGIAGVAPTIDYRFALTGTATNYGTNGSATISATVDSDGTFVNAGGLIQQATTNQLRFDTDPTTLLCRGVLVEAERTNIVTASANLGGGTWIILGSGGASVSNNVALAPDGTATADKFSVGNVTGNWYIADYFAGYAGPQQIASGQAYTWSAYVKPAGLNFVFFRVLNNTSNLGASGVIFNLLTGAVTLPPSPLAPGVSNAKATNVGNGWFKCEATSVANASFSGGGGAGIWAVNSNSFSTNSGAGPANFAGDGTSGLLIWGAQWEVGSTSTSLIPTTSAAVTRSADSITLNAGLTGTFTMVEKPAGCAVVSGSNIVLQTGYTVERVMSFPVTLTNDQITAIRAAM